MTRGRVGDRSGSRGGQRAVDRGLSPVLGVVLLVGIVVLGTVVVTLVGGVALDGSRSSVEISRAEGAMAELDARASDTALGLDDTAARNVDFGPTGRDGYLETTRDSWIRVSVVNASTGVEDANVVNASLGTVTYANGETTVAYEGGGVWRADGEGSTMLSPPEFHFRNATLTLPVINVSSDSDAGLTERLSVRRAGPPDRQYPDPSRDLVNRVEDSKVTITVHSDYYLAWGRYFEETTDGIVTYDHGAQTSTVKFLSVPQWFSLGSGIVATSGTNELAVEGGGSGLKTDSYNSSNGTYASQTPGDEGDIVIGGDVTLKGGSDIDGDVWSGGDVYVGNQPTIGGDVYSIEEPELHSNNEWSGNWIPIPGIGSLEPIDQYVKNTADNAQANNDNNNSNNITTQSELDLTSGSVTLYNGTYYLEHITLKNNDELILNTTEGDINIVVRNRIMMRDGDIRVEGERGNVTVFLVGDSLMGGNHHLEMQTHSSVSVQEDVSSRFRVYGTSHLAMDLGGGSTFVGILYAPAGEEGTGNVYIQQADIFGAVITGTLDIKEAGIHYDEALEQELLPRSPTVSRIEFMHVAVHEVDVTNR